MHTSIRAKANMSSLPDCIFGGEVDYSESDAITSFEAVDRS